MASKTLAQLRSFTRTLLSEPTASYWSDSELNIYINDGIDDLCSVTNLVERITTNSLVQYQADYAIPSNATAIKHVEIVKGNSIYLLIPEDLREQYQGTVKSTSNPPNYYNYFEGNLRLRERPSVAAQSTTLNGTISASDVSLVLTSASSLPRMGRLLIDSEVIGYWSNSGTTFSGLIRGMEGTTAASHTTGATVTLRDLWVYHYMKENLSSDSDTTLIPSQFDEAVCYFAAAVSRRKSKDHDLAREYQAIYNDYILKANSWAKLKWRRPFVPK